MTRQRAGCVAAILLLLATVVFGVGIAIEKAEQKEEEPTRAATTIQRTDAMEAGSEAAEHGEGETGSEHSEETLLGIDVESTPVIVFGIVVSLVVIAALLFLAQRPWILEAAALFVLVFGVLDLVEVGRKWGDEATIAAFALAAAVLHLAAAAVLAAAATRRPATAGPTPG